VKTISFKYVNCDYISEVKESTSSCFMKACDVSDTELPRHIQSDTQRPGRL